MEIKKNQEKNECKTSKRERRKKFNKIKDVLHRGCGKRIFQGIGNGKQLVCDICGKRIYKSISEVIKEKIYVYCDKTSCRNEISKLKEK